MNRKTALVPFLFLIVIVILAVVFSGPAPATTADTFQNISGADTAWMLTATALV
jgi:hypothetical protein